MDGALVHICETRISLSSMRFLHTVCKRAKRTYTVMSSLNAREVTFRQLYCNVHDY